MNKNIVLIVVFWILALPFAVFADDEEPDVKDMPTRERILVGGNIGLQISNINTMVLVSPRIGYRLTNRLTSGLGLTYQYYRHSGWGNTQYRSVTHIYGGSLFSRFSITRQLFLQAEYEALNLDSRMGTLINTDSDNRFWEQNYFLGGGYRAPLGSRASINLMLLYNFNQNSVVYFQNPIFRVGVDVSL